MSAGSKWTPGKIFLLVIGILAGLGILCCGGIYAFWGEEIKSGVNFSLNNGKFAQRLQADFGKKTVFGFEQTAQREMLLTIGVEGELTPERVREVQDGAWKAFGEVFAVDGYLPIKRLAVGRPLTTATGQPGAVSDWSANIVSVEELVQRTGVAVPPPVKFLPKDFGDGMVKVTVKSEPSETDEGEGKEGGGGGGK